MVRLIAKKHERKFTLRISEESQPYDTEELVSPKLPKKSISSSELSLLFALKQMHRFRPYFAGAGCLSLLSSMKLCTIFAKQTELGSNSVSRPSLLNSCCGDGSTATVIGFSAEEIRNCLSKSFLRRDLNTGLAEAVRTGSLKFS